jgi:hypothetical protein
MSLARLVMGAVYRDLSVPLASTSLNNLVGASFWSGVLLLVVAKRRRLAVLPFSKGAGPDLFAYAPFAPEAGAAWT